MKYKVKLIGEKLFYILGTIGIVDMMVNAWTNGEMHLIQRFLALFFTP